LSAVAPTAFYTLSLHDALPIFSPHEECAVEEAVQITERDGGSVSVLTLGPEAAIEQLRGALALGAHRAVLLETDGRELEGQDREDRKSTRLNSSHDQISYAVFC